ncbi:hypothetical protein PG991_001775 [Apiospora marii]|uniref:Uncharacterized protein n=1 Tax=Apiospora marii TaxID=335849 RepID=A0ABR1SMY5_9PEZI
MAKFINVAHSEHSPNTGGGTPTAPRASGVRPDNYSRFHLSGFSFYHGEPMDTHQAVRDFLQKPAFMPWRKSRGEVDSYLRFETTLRVLFEAVIFFEEFWGRRGFWAKIRTLLKLDNTVSADTLEDAVKLYCDGRRHCLAKVPKPGKPPNKIAELAEIVDRFRPGEHAPIPKADWARREDKWRSKLYYVLTNQGVHSQQVQDGSCHPVLLDPLPSPLSASPRSETQRRDRFETRPRSPPRRPSSPSRRPPSPPRRSSLDQPRQPREIEAPRGPKAGLPPKPPAPARSKEPTPAAKEKATTPTAPATHQRELPAKSTAETVSREPEPTHSVQSLDELVDTYKHPSDPVENPRKRSRDEPPEGADTPNKRLAAEPTGSSPRPGRPTVPPIETQQPLYENTCSRFESTVAEDTPATQEPQRNEKVAVVEGNDEMILDAIEVAVGPEKLSTESMTPAHTSGQNNDTAMTKVADRVRSPDAMSDSLFVEKTELPVEGAAEPVDAIRELLLCLEQRQVRLEALEASADSQKKLMETWAADRKRIAELEAQLGGGRASDARQFQSLHDKAKKHSEQLKQQSSVNQQVEERVEATAREVREVKTTLGHYISDAGRARIEDASVASEATAQVREELWQKCETDGELFRQTNRAVEEVKKQMAEADLQNGQQFAEVERRSQEVQRQFSDVEDRLQHQIDQHAGVCRDQWERHSSACQVQRAGSDDSTETRLAELQRQLGQVQDALQAREAIDRAAPPPPPPAPIVTSFNGALSNGVDPGVLSSLDTGTFLDTMYYEMSKLRTAMRTRIRAMDVEGVPDEDDSKLAVSDISYELGRVLDVARKRINKL